MNFPKSSLELSHFPVMLKEVIKNCSTFSGGNFIDCTFGGGGYSKELLKLPNSHVIALDRDNGAALRANIIKKKYPERFNFFNEKFSNLEKVLNKKYKADAIIFDLGLSSFQLLDFSRGFSFRSNSRIDMNMGLSSVSAENIINNFSEIDLKHIIKVFGDENEASKIVRNIVKERNIKKITTVTQLVEIIKKSKKKNYKKKINVCTKTFQALRIFVNKETTELIEGITKATKFVKSGGKIIIVSFHSIEDKIVKFYFTNYSNNKSRPSRYLPEEKNKFIFFENYKNKAIKPSSQEIITNPPSRSAKLRVAIRNKNEFKDVEEFKLKFKKYLNLEEINV